MERMMRELVKDYENTLQGEDSLKTQVVKTDVNAVSPTEAPIWTAFQETCKWLREMSRETEKSGE